MSDRIDDAGADAGQDDGLVAVVGLACRYPGAENADEFWHNLVRGRETVTRFPRRPTPRGGSEYTPARGLLKDPEWFDADYFGFSPREARLLNPQHRVFLECAVEALEDAGQDPDRHSGRVGVYAGSTDTAYAQLLKERRDELPSVTDMEILVANAPDYLASRVAYKLGLRGPAVVVQAACATSLVAVHTAVQALLSGDCDLALAGGVAVRVPAKESPYIEGGIISADGVCRTFDAAAGGTVGGDGVGIVVLKRLADARADGDRIRAVLRGSAVNNDGSDRVGFTAPSVSGQAAVIREAQLVAGVDADTVTYVEAHGTATPLGDPIEITALTRAFREDTDRAGFCGIGAVKTNIGHTDAAAGAAGLIKTVLALEHGVLPPSLNYTAPNPGIDFASSPFEVVTEVREWRPDGGVPRRAGVSSFGIGGTNAHVILEQAPEPARTGAEPGAVEPGPQLLVLSARTETALDTLTGRLAAHLRDRPGLALPDVAWTLQTGRRELPVRRCAVVDGPADAVRVLDGLDRGRLTDSAAAAPAGPLTLFFPGTATRADTRDLSADPLFRRTVEECLALADPDAEVPEALDVFATELALGRLWQSWGVRAAAVAGHGTGALVAETVAGVYTVEDAVRLILTGAGAGRGPRPPRSPGRWRQRRHPPRPEHPGPHGGVPARTEDIQVSTAGADASAEDRGITLLPVLPEEAGALGARAALLTALGRLWLGGLSVDWSAVHGAGRRRKVALPTYPFERRRYVVEPLAPASPDATPKASPAPEAPTAVVPQASGAPDVLTAVSELFARTLGLESVGPDAGFFDLGGDSLVATQLLALARESFGVELESSVLYDAQTPAEFAALVADRLGGRTPEPAPVA
ncbi:phosphopantetheine-binding protein [Streptomyces cynarae]|uniref:Phosphopantetheine-binding protein n=1 Tax=Streptomyces cynarae TaxID=2981134 RepID=A0ABY6DZS2_9ACTN|nr:beta-ketoacyl synthase N-terminal-like domain-containing protein [Streptomyces cynarae]UXY19845.1 phosphopantetheine-binding protein [Streptomyces cynarae]